MAKMQLSNNTPLIHPASDENILIAAKMLQAGEIIAFPTETVYGLGAAAHDERAVRKIYAAKGRPSNNPLIIHVDSLQMAMQYGVFNERALALAEAFFPSALTLVVPLVVGTVADAALAGGQTVAIRCPAHPTARALIAAAGFGIAAPSANISGQISPTRAQHVEVEFAHLPLFILGDVGDACEIGLESTVLDCTSSELHILRYGAITEIELNLVSTPNFLCPPPSPLPQGEGGLHRTLSDGKSSMADNQFKPILKSPGQLESHYAPKSRLRLNVIAPEVNELYLGFGDYSVAGGLNLSAEGGLVEAAHNLYDYLRQLDDLAQRNRNISGIACAPIPCYGIGIAINDRLTRAAFAK